ncbi:uridine diphosphate-N-acetylglucosamine-binding protein YvcK [Vibrio mangrovi]|uniref:Putative gluconeogenesis factor n=1 Tax=Vibrio mangrovi TaxID=474394 RepID=A0A1Y6IQ19_9VIBR|nr:uridine diphosphate-N-acetylglucosamine-binding protein YvcK [Vibrio mangrovi]MDW6003480.1 uridine diphosphate-N-acetylglucosamine-binding protein YvcK [Vibrio mangrovi]SMR99728.1 Gluconeogenesis factor [Vibrio mangrovi]
MNQYQNKLYQEKKIVAIGGGHGLGRVLAAIRDFGSNATGIVATTDNGGSTGRIRHCQGGIAWGDTRNCINQLITEPSTASMMFEYRFRGQGELDGHNLGNLMLTALDNLSVRPLEAINLIRTLLNVSINILPMSEHPSDLTALSVDGKIVTGETSVDEMTEDLIRLELSPQVPATREAIEAIAQADAIILGPGSFLTSVMPPLLLPELGKAIAKNRQAILVYIDNLAPEYGPARNMNLNRKLIWCQRACSGRQVDVVLCGASPAPLEDKCCRIVVRKLASPNKGWRHEREKLKQAIEELLITELYMTK